MLQRLLRRAEDTVVDRPRSVLAAAVGLCVVAVWLGGGIEFRTSRRELVPQGDPTQARWDELQREFSGPEPLIVALEALTADVAGEQLESVARQLGASFVDDPLASRVFYRVDLDWLTDHALYLAPPERLEAAVQQIDELLAGDDGGVRLSGFAELNERIAARIEESLASGTVLLSQEADEAADRLRELIAQQRRFLEDPSGYVEALGESPLGLLETADRGSITANGYLATHDERTVFVLISMAGDDGDLALQQALVAAARQRTETLLAVHPGIGYGLTGAPAMDVEEMAALRRDGRQTTLIATAGVFVLSLFAFQLRRHALVGLLTLAAGVVWSIGAVRLELGSLNMITTALIPILVGMGIDYAVHPISQYELERRTKERPAAVRAAMRKTGAAVTVSALTTSAAFFCFLLMDFRGFSELGLVTGVGVLLCLLAALMVLPALLVLHGAWHDPDGAPRKAAVDHVWDDDAARLLTRAPRLAVGLFVLLSLAAAGLASGVEMRRNLLELLPASAESLRYLQVLNEESALSNDFNLVTARSLAELQQLRDRADAAQEIERFESVLTFLPAEPEAAANAVQRAAALLDRLSLMEPGAGGHDRRASSLARLEEALAEAADVAFVTGLGGLSGALERGRAEAEAALALVDAASPAELAAWMEAEGALRTKLRPVLDRVRVAARADVPTLETLPKAIADRFVTSGGRFLGYLHPAGDMYDPAFLPRFNTASREVADDAIGFPMLFHDHAELITSGFGAAFLSGALLVFVLLWIDFRDPRLTLLAIVPVMAGTLWMLGFMALAGLSFNLANLVAVPIVLGVGIDAGVHVVHRYRLEGNEGMITVVSHTGRAILIGSLTTMVGFGSLALAAHRGMASLGLLLLIGVGSCTVAALGLLPNLIVALGLARR